MKLAKIVTVLAIALAVVAIAVPAGAQFCPWGLGGFGLGGCGFGGGAAFQSSFTATSSFNTFGTAGVAAVPFGFCGVPFGLGACGLGFGGLGFGGCGFGMPFGFC